MTTSRKNRITIVISLITLLAIMAFIAYFFFVASNDNDELFSPDLFILLIVVVMLLAALVVYFLSSKKINTVRAQVTSKEINNCIITPKSICIDAEFECPVDCRYYKHGNCYWEQKSQLRVHEHKLEGIIVYFNLSYTTDALIFQNKVSSLTS